MTTGDGEWSGKLRGSRWAGIRPGRRIGGMQAVAATLLCALIALVAAGALEDPLATPAPIDGDERVHVGALDDLDCARCHAQVAQEWAATLHAFAWQDGFYQEELEGRRKPQSCWGCHIPEPVHVTGLDSKPVARDDARHLGVTCVACHGGPEGTILGPHGAPTDAHASRRAETFVGAGTNALCATCHGTFVGPVIGLSRDFADSARAAAGGSCVECHMAEVERSFALTPAEGGGEPYASPVRKGRSHALQTPRDPAFLRRAFGLAAALEGGRAVLRVENRAGHRVPGLIGRELTLAATLLDDSGAELESRELEIDTSGPLETDETRTLEFGGIGARVRVRGTHADPRLLQPVEFLALELPLE